MVLDPALGFVHPLNNHGTHYYLSAMGPVSLTLAVWCGWPALMLVFVLLSKDFGVPPRNTPRWVTHVSAVF